LPFIGELTDFEKLVYVLGEEGFSISEIAKFLNSSYSSIRTIKGKITRKINKSEEEIGADF
jgi:DNA-binding NarL/FixJ family response regulator